MCEALWNGRVFSSVDVFKILGTVVNCHIDINVIVGGSLTFVTSKNDVN